MFVGENRFFSFPAGVRLPLPDVFQELRPRRERQIRGNRVAALQEHFDAAVRRLLAPAPLVCTEIDAMQIPMNFTGHIVIHRREHLIAAL